MTSCRDAGLDRLHYVDGSRLLAGDLRDTRGDEARWQALHVRGAHSTWGVATGLGVTVTTSRRGVVVEAGAAFDCRGRVIRLAQPVELPLPAATAPGLLTAAFDVVLGAGGPRWEATGGGPDYPGFGDGVRPGIDIPLGRCVRLIWGVLTGPDPSFRRTVHRMTRPRVGFGQTAAGELSWTLETWSIRASVDTSTAEFGSIPQYVAWTAQVPDLGGLIGPFLSLSLPYSNRFIVRLSACSAAALPAPAVLATLLARAADIRIAWMGIEPNAGCAGGTPGGVL